MAIRAVSRGFRESDGQYTTVSVSIDPAAGEDLLSNPPPSNQTITAAFNASRDHLGSLINANRVVKRYTIHVEYLDVP